MHNTRGLQSAAENVISGFICRNYCRMLTETLRMNKKCINSTTICSKIDTLITEIWPATSSCLGYPLTYFYK